MRFCGIWSNMLRKHSVIYSVRLVWTTSMSLGPFCMLFTTLDDSCHCLWITVDSLRHWNETWGSLGMVSTLFCQQKYLFPELIIIFFLNKKYLFQIKWNKMISKFKTMHILLTNVHLDCRGEGSSNRNSSRDESVETGDQSVETGDESIEAGGKT